MPIEATDHISVPPLEGFVMNRVLGDYFETLLYKIFVSVDEKTSVGEVTLIMIIVSRVSSHLIINLYLISIYSLQVSYKLAWIK